MDERLPVPARARVWHTRKRWLALLGAVVALPLVVERVGSGKLLLSTGVAHAQLAHGTWRHMFALHGVAAAAPLPIWMLALAGAGVIGFPYAWLVARSLPDRGYAAHVPCCRGRLSGVLVRRSAAAGVALVGE